MDSRKKAQYDSETNTHTNTSTTAKKDGAPDQALQTHSRKSVNVGDDDKVAQRNHERKRKQNTRHAPQKQRRRKKIN